MIAWNAFVDYFVDPGEKVKTAIIVITVLAVIFRNKLFVQKVFNFLKSIGENKLLLAVILIGFALRLGWILWSPHIEPSANTEDYKILYHARNIAAGEGVHHLDGRPTAVRPIGYSLFLAGFFKVFGERMLLVEFLQVLFQTLSIFILFKIGSQIRGKAVGLLAAGLYAIYPTSIYASKIVLEEHMFIPLWLGGLSLMIWDFNKPHWGKVICGGLILGISAHFRTYGFLMGGIVFLMWFFMKRQYGMAFLRGFVIQLLIISWAVPWAIRNYHAFGEPILYTSAIGRAFYYSNNHTADVRWPINPTLEQGGDRDFILAKDEVAQSNAGKKAAFKWIKENPGTFVQKAIGRTIYMLGLSREGWTVQDNFHTLKEGRQRPSGDFISRLDKMDSDYYGLIFLLALIGFTLFWFDKNRDYNRKNFYYIFLTLAYYLAIVALTIGHRKYRFSIEPIFCLLAGYGIYQLWFSVAAKRLNLDKGNAVTSQV